MLFRRENLHMSEDLEEILEDIKMYAGIVFGMLLILDIILVASMYQEYGTVFGYNTAMNNVIFICCFYCARCLFENSTR